jgi:hypothetical protein
MVRRFHQAYRVNGGGILIAGAKLLRLHERFVDDRAVIAGDGTPQQIPAGLAS